MLRTMHTLTDIAANLISSFLESLYANLVERLWRPLQRSCSYSASDHSLAAPLNFRFKGCSYIDSLIQSAVIRLWIVSALGALTAAIKARKAIFDKARKTSRMSTTNLRRRMPSAKAPSQGYGFQPNLSVSSSRTSASHKAKHYSGVTMSGEEADAILQTMAKEDDPSKTTWSRLFVKKILSKVRKSEVCIGKQIRLDLTCLTSFEMSFFNAFFQPQNARTVWLVLATQERWKGAEINDGLGVLRARYSASSFCRRSTCWWCAEEGGARGAWGAYRAVQSI